MNPIYAAISTSIFEEISGLARAHGAINLGQGFPDDAGPEDVRRAAADAVLTRSNQYPPMAGLPELRRAVADHYARFQALDVAPEEVLVTSGATEAIAAALFALIAPGDEVWEHVLFDGRAHVPLIALPGMRERAVKIGSAGKIFSMTGWKVGFAVAARPILDVIARAHQFLTFTTPPSLQAAVAYGLGKEAGYFAAMRARYQRSRDRLASALAAGGYAVLSSEASYFLNIDLAASGIAEGDRDFCRRIVTGFGVAGIPVSAFYAEHVEGSIVRLCFAKKDDVLDEAAQRLIAARS